MWRSINGLWEVVKGEKYNYVIDKKVKSYKWGYNELINHNTFVTIDPIEKYDSICFHVKFTEPLKENVRFMIPFSIKEDRVFYAFRFIGNENAILKIDFIQSAIKDLSKPIEVKWNFEVKELKTVEHALAFNIEYFMEIRIERKKTTLLIDKRPVLIVDVPAEEVDSGKFGFSSLHMKPMIWSIAVMQNRKAVFLEDFSKDRFRRVRVEGKVEKKN
ncbi:MAG: hypothetical protein N2316_10910 [Spirochaetes bacterium]|nr:hypothetical protein [Spirochaetota bacterium]